MNRLSKLVLAGIEFVPTTRNWQGLFLALYVVLLSWHSPALAGDKQSADNADSTKPLSPRAGTSETKSTDEPLTDKWALIVGISKYKDPSLNLKYAAKDASDFRDFLIKEANFAPDHIHLLLDEQATKERILAEFGDRWLPRVARPNDLVVVYFSSHGSPSEMDIRGVNYIVTHDTDRDSLFSTGLSMRDVVEAIKDRVNSKRVMLILDACHSGATSENKGIVRQTNYDADAIAQGTGQLVICSSMPDEATWESKNYQNGVFTRHLIEGLSQKDGQLTVDDAFKLTRARVQEEVLRDRGEMQTPVLKSKWSGQTLMLSAKPTDPRPGIEEQVLYSGNRSVKPDADTSRTDGIAGTWDSNWGQVTFEHDPIEGDKPVEVSGHWQQGPKKTGVFKSGTFDPATGIVKVTYYQNWNFLKGSAKFKVNKKGNRMDGSFRQALILGGTWILWR